MNERLKHRLVGAVVLVILAVIVVPMVLKPPLDADKSSPRPSVTLQVQESTDSDDPASGVTKPSQLTSLTRQSLHRSAVERGGGLRTYQKHRQPVFTEGSIGGRSRAQPPPTNGRTQPVRNGTKVTTRKGEVVSSTGPAGSKIAAWAVQLGSFSKRNNAVALRDRLQERGFPAFVRPPAMSDAELTRVYVGPELSREEARHLSQTLTKEIRLRGLVVPYP